MFGFKKKKEERLPELPSLPELPELLPLPSLGKKEKTGLPPLPSFPLSQTGELVSREAVKHAIRQEENLGFEPSTITAPMTREIEEFPKPSIKTFKPPIAREVVREIKPSIRAEPLFVRIDKYQDSLANLQEVKKKVLEIENLLREIKEVKAREDLQLQEWENEIQEAKSKLDKIDRTIFQKLEE